ncbi:hypothetical protein HAX54_022907 [Datura stramonium]|uniref:Uncharacterized protein n=1 Tax=Datura stramonium TaxID=4076 RepID=A0ABS8UWN8_DATST|nr:hypothetical protein [Datura stramonium]
MVPPHCKKSYVYDSIRILEQEMLSGLSSPERRKRQGAKQQEIPEMLERLSLCCHVAKATNELQECIAANWPLHEKFPILHFHERVNDLNEERVVIGFDWRQIPDSSFREK